MPDKKSQKKRDSAFATGAFGQTLNRMGNGFAGRGGRYSARYRNAMFGK